MKVSIDFRGKRTAFDLPEDANVRALKKQVASVGMYPRWTGCTPVAPRPPRRGDASHTLPAARFPSTVRALQLACPCTVWACPSRTMIPRRYVPACRPS
ncbi:hypothetical protein EON67_05090 [archaeon]|nr:MAG: hypothetical protein EON67_05090 [archaeon]